MSDAGPYSMDHDPGRPEIERLAVELMTACEAMILRQLDGKTVVSKVEGGDVVDRSITSAAIQAIWNAGAARQDSVFDQIDGVAHAMASSFAQMSEDAAHAGFNLLLRNTVGYEARTRAALQRPAGESH